MTSVDMILAQIRKLPPFPLTVTRIIKLLRNPLVSPDEIVEVIKYDQAITANILRLCNSTYFGISRQITNLREAVIYLGIDELKKTVILSGTQKYFNRENPGYEAQRGELWRHILAVTVIGEQYVTIIDMPCSDELFLSALLHDIGKLVLSDFVKDASWKITRLVEKGKMSFLDAEKQIIGLNHAEVGAKILDMWKFPDDIISAVKKHHQPLQEGDSTLENIVRLSDSLALMMGYETTVDGLAYHAFSEICTLYGISHTMLDKIMADSLEKLKKIETEYSVPLEV